MANGRMIAAAIGSALLGAAAASALHAAAEETPKAYMIAQVEVRDAETFARDYAPKVQGAIEPFGGRYLARAGRTVPLEGKPPAGRVALIEFPSLAAAQEFYASPTYKAIAAVRHRTANTDAFVIEGVAPPK